MIIEKKILSQIYKNYYFNLKSLNLKDEISGQSPGEVLKKIGMKIMTTVGGSSGALFATLLIGMAKRYNDKLSDQKNVAEMFTEGVEAMKKRGKMAKIIRKRKKSMKKRKAFGLRRRR